MIYNYLADFVVILHFLFVLFVVLGGFFVLWRTLIAWFHIPTVLWGATIEFFGWICPLTHLEVMLRKMGGSAGYDRTAGFVEYYIMPVLYPESLTRRMQVIIGVSVLLVNAVIYLSLWHRLRKGGGRRD